MESVEDLRQWMTSATKANAPAPAPTAKPATRKALAGGENDPAQPFRPTVRPPLLVVCIVDEGKNGGEWVRVRGDRAIIGRAEGDILIPHDPGISGRHAELFRAVMQGRHRWALRDLNSTNGTFIRVTVAPLEQQQEILIGTRRFRFEAGAGAAPPGALGDAARNSTRGWQALTPESISGALPSLVPLLPTGPGERILLTADENWIGADASCRIAIRDDPFVSPRHARLVRNQQQRWQIENNQSRNGVWMRITEMALDPSCEFQAGEQRFLVKVC